MFRYKIDVIAELRKHGVTYYNTRKTGLFSQGTMHALSQGKSVTLETLDKVCCILDCQLSDIIEIIPDSDISD